MNSDHHRDPAQDTTKAQQAPARQGVVVAFPERRAATVEFGSGWYHDAAIKESAQGQDRRQ